MFRNIAGQKITFLVIDTATNLPKTGDAANLTAYVSKDDGSVTVLADTSATELDATNAPGVYSFDLAQGETNAHKLVFTGKSATSGVRVVPKEYVTQNYQLDRSARSIVNGTVDSGASTTSIPTSSLDPAAAVTDQFKGRVVVFDKDTTSANLRGQATDITASTSGGVLTVTALTNAPASGDTFVIL